MNNPTAFKVAGDNFNDFLLSNFPMNFYFSDRELEIFILEM